MILKIKASPLQQKFVAQFSFCFFVSITKVSTISHQMHIQIFPTFTVNVIVLKLIRNRRNPRDLFLQLVTSGATRGKRRSKTTTCLFRRETLRCSRRKVRPPLCSPMIPSDAGCPRGSALYVTSFHLPISRECQGSRCNFKLERHSSNLSTPREASVENFAGAIGYRTSRKLGQVRISRHVHRPRGNRNGKSSRGAWHFCNPFVEKGR